MDSPSLRQRMLAAATGLPLIWALLAPAPALAAGNAAAAKPLGELYEVAQLMDAAVLDLNMLLGEEQSPAYKARLDETLKKLEAAQKSSSGSLGGSGVSAQNAGKISENVAGFIKLARENRDATMQSGAPENAVVDGMMQHRNAARETLDTLYADLEKQAGLAGSPISEARELALLLQKMSATYVENASSAYVSNRSQDSKDIPIDQMARGFSPRLNQLLVKARNEEAARLVRSIQSKWKFIEKSMLHYQEKTVPFLVDRYTQAIVVDLMSLAHILEKAG